MEYLPANALGWLRASLFTAKCCVPAAACFIGVFRSFSNDFRVAVVLIHAVATLLLLVGGFIQIFTIDKPRASLNLVFGFFAVLVLGCLLPVLNK
jgi:hypothetical protein